ncbi:MULTISPECIES: DUF7344 domain-containing protein [Halorussus]|uniref:DUF7344 domain-containing protein n=1 Tax=Halorussus TaxID=1070314 RepID=UPI00209E7B28|nr:hypothetical protein [Halorussus vallis]USZ78031.1 hypothetical protein NGM07_20425 [Halorussus vallis]
MPDDASGSDDRDASPAGSDASGDVVHDRLDETFELMSNRRCRYALYHFDSASVDVFDFEELVDAVAAWERETDAADVERGETDAADAEAKTDGNHRQAVAVALHHDCLPRLVDFGAVEYDPRSKTIRYYGSDDLTPYLRLSVSLDRR